MIDKYINRIINADCYNVLKYLPDKSVDLCLTDFPYGVQVDYDGYEDSNENLVKLINLVMPQILRVSKRALITCGTPNIQYYPKPTWILAWYIPAGAGYTPWGFSTWQPILAYGKDPYLENGMGGRHDSIKWIESSEKNGHPCPKPYKFWEMLLLRGSVFENEIILDPFGGSGTTALAAMNTNRRFIVIEKSSKYCEIAMKRISHIATGYKRGITEIPDLFSG